LLPFGGYKGSGIAMMVEFLAGALVGDNFSFETAAKDNTLIKAVRAVEFPDTQFCPSGNFTPVSTDTTGSSKNYPLRKLHNPWFSQQFFCHTSTFKYKRPDKRN